MSLPPPRVIITSYTPSGTSIIASDQQVPPFHPFGPTISGFSTFHTSDSVPISNNTSPTQPAPPPGPPRCPSNGTLFCTTDIPPGGVAPMHRTLSIDYACVLAGEIVMELDGGERTVVKTGDVIVQRGAMHSWRNEGEGTCRILFVMVGSEKVVTEDGRELGEVAPKPPTK